MMETIGLSLSITHRCNASCRHCGVNGAARTGPVMSPEEAAAHVREAATLPTLRSVAITGGEPMLYPETVRAILVEARQHEIWGELVSNSFFAATPHAAQAALEPLVRLGLRKYVTSLDRFHLEYVPPGCLANAVQAARDLGLDVMVKTLDHGEGALSQAEIEDCLGPELSGVEFQRFALVRSGRARSMAPESTGRAWPGACDRIIRFPTLTADGRLYGCCSFGDTARLVGSVATESLPALLERMQGMLLLRLLSWRGPQGVVDLAADMDLPLPDEEFQGPCDLCTALWEHPHLRDCVAAVLCRLAVETGEPRRDLLHAGDSSA